jgi:hypothetical protein
VGPRSGVDSSESNDNFLVVQFVASHNTDRAAVVHLSKEIPNYRPAYSTVTAN